MAYETNKWQNKCIKLRAENKRLRKELTDWLKYAKGYDPYGPNSVSRYGRAAAGMEKVSIIKRLERILAPPKKGGG